MRLQILNVRELISDHKKGMQEVLDDLLRQMEQLDENSKDYLELDFEFNWTSGQVAAANYFLSAINDMLECEHVYDSYCEICGIEGVE